MVTQHGDVGAKRNKRVRRNTQGLIDKAGGHFAAARLEGLMAVYARPLAGRAVAISTGKDEERRVVDFVRCAYLGLDNHPDIVRGAIEAVERYGTLHWSCARTRLNFGLIGDLEGSLSDLFSARVIAYTTVLAANMGALPILASGHLTNGKKPVMVFDKLAHASLAFHKGTIAEETEVVTIAHNDLEALETICRGQRPVAYICDGIYSMGGSAPIADLLSLQQRYGLFLYIDDAHGISIFGRNGEGYARSQIPGELGERTIIAASLGKGFGASGGLIMLGTQRQEDLFRNFAVAHAFSASPNVAAIGAALASASLHRTPELHRRQAALQDRLRQFDGLCETSHAQSRLPIRMVTIGDELAAIGAAHAILDRGFYLSAVFFPTVQRGRAGLRICPTAGHVPEGIENLCRALAAIVPIDEAAKESLKPAPPAGHRRKSQ
ncbi:MULTISPECIES: aminotransferase class I/II-fold pyridoxal phosphate-dependent enzyme [unclassified Mesorhizobium]|uniref:8-amino-7-oxononanoate synthase family protein n=1 Tax=unclassified Mesorhizobium TaxID=325217 RepID=UPI001CCD75A3|nr:MULTISPECIES: aminotransferase class I/II-fold pyridoxal phosphate-dependent enzyme [unclassified Mesorhizobium]MBZ9739804.1 aminotransferase class I/II-fold pyridoxal phosphate-dependent enzyme [Mesorhizobium sp. CO1-1-4]MBZ9804932.1 aminotransferase class I/II-fold pyridoxal phosphate-dependent enzyme [Mesorhizobium sp. ES1-6]